MAERFPRYEQQLGQLNIPDVDFAAEREIAKGYNQIGQQLDRMSSFFMQQAETQFKLEGAEYGAANAPTEQQIIDAYNDGEEIDLVGDNFSVYGRAARQAAMNAATDDIEFLAKKEILMYITEAEAGEYDVATVNDKIDTIIAGYSGVLDGESPGNAKKLRANLGIFGYGKSQQHASDMLKIQRQREQASFAASFNLALEGIEDIIRTATSQEVMIDEATAAQTGQSPGTPITVGAAKVADTMLDKGLQTVLKRAVQLRYSKAQIDNIVKMWNDEIVIARKNVVLGEVIGHEEPRALLQNMTGAVRELNQGGGTQYREQLPPQLRNALALADATERAELLDLARTQWHTLIEDENKQITFSENQRQENIRKAHSLFTLGLRSENLIVMRSAAGEMNAYDGAKAQVMEEAIDKIETEGFQTATNLGAYQKTDIATKQKYQIDLVQPNPQYTLSDITADYTAKNLSFDDFLTLAEKYEAQYDADIQAALREVKARVGIPADQFIDANFLDKAAYHVYTTIEKELLKGKRLDTDGTFNAQNWIDENLESLLGTVMTPERATLVKLMGDFPNITEYLKAVRKEEELGNTDRAIYLLDQLEKIKDLVATDRNLAIQYSGYVVRDEE